MISLNRKMNNRVYYGEYTVEYWIDQMLSGALQLPPYQRAFIWTKTQVKGLINAMRADLYIPPVTIGSIDGKNVIIDGQQRLTSLLLAYLGVFPARNAYGGVESLSLDGNGDDDSEEPEEREYLKWTFQDLHEFGNDVRSIKESLSTSPNYEILDSLSISEEFIKKHFLGFSFIVMNSETAETDSNAHFSAIFRNINIGGTPLLKAESRQALYYRTPEYLPLFAPDFASSITLQPVGSRAQPLDFLRLLALAFDYARDDDERRVMRGFKSKPESYYESFISEVVTPEEGEGRFLDFRQVMDVDDIHSRMENFANELHRLNAGASFPSIIDLDVYFIGLVYWVLIKNKRISDADGAIDELKSSISAAIVSFKEEEGHAKSPSALKYLRQRIRRSIEDYGNYMM